MELLFRRGGQARPLKGALFRHCREEHSRQREQRALRPGGLSRNKEGPVGLLPSEWGVRGRVLRGAGV